MQIFVNRAPECEAFQELLSTQEDHRVLVYHGISGIGKTSLLRKLRDNIGKGNNVEAISGSVDFAEPEYGRPAEALKQLRRELAASAKAAKTSLMFNAFDLAICAYTYKAFGAERSKPLAEELIQLSDGPVQKMLRIVAVAGGSVIPVLGPFSQDVVNQAIEHMKRDHALASALCEAELRALQQKESAEILQLLPFFFGHDLALYQKRSGAKHIAIFMDSYDELWGGFEAKQQQRGAAIRDKWIRQLVKNAPRVLFVVAGRNRFNWENLSQICTTSLVRHEFELGELEREDAFEFLNQFLKQHGIEEQGVLQSTLTKIFGTTQGHPFWLKLAAEQYFRVAHSGGKVTPDMLDLNESDILDSLCIGLTQEEQQTVKQLSAVVYFDEELFKRLLSDPLDTGYPKQAFTDFIKLSFVEHSTGEHYRIHSVMKLPMLRELEERDPGRLQTIRDVQSRYFQEKGFPFGIDALIQGYDDVVRILKDAYHGQISGEQLDQFLDSERFCEIRDAGEKTKTQIEEFKRLLNNLNEATKQMDNARLSLRETLEKSLNNIEANEHSDSSESDKT